MRLLYNVTFQGQLRSVWRQATIGPMRRILKRQKDGSLLLDQELVDSLTGQGQTLVLHSRPGSLVLTPAVAPRLDQRFVSALEHWEKNAGLHFLEGCFSQNAGGTSGMFKGDLSILNANDVVLFLAGGKKTGQLAVVLPGQRMAVFFREGKLVRVSSEGVEDQWPQFLLQRHEATSNDVFVSLESGALGHRLEKQLARLVHLAAPEQLERHVTHEQALLYQILRAQEGEFVFFEGNLPLEETRQFPLDISNYVLEAARILDETSRLEAILPGKKEILDAMPVEGLSLEPEEAALFGLVDGQRSVGQILDASSLNQGDSVRLLSSLIQAGLVRPQAQEKPPQAVVKQNIAPEVNSRLEDIFSRYQDVFQMVLPALTLEKGEQQVRLILETFWNGPAQSTVLSTVPFPGAAGLMGQEVIQAAVAKQPDDPQGAMVHALNELLYFLLFAVKDNLGPEVEQGIVEAARSVLGNS